MAILASANWYIRAGGNALNGGGFDAAIAGAGTNYCDQDAPQLSLTDLATPGAGSTTLTSATGGFTAAMIGNCIRIASGTPFQAGYYFVTAYTDTNTVTLDRTPSSGGAGSGGTGRLGGAFASFSGSFSSGGTVTAPTIASPVKPGNQINICGSGGDAPSSADFTQTGYASYPAGDSTDGQIRVVGYNGRPRIDINDIFFYNTQDWRFEHLLLKLTGGANDSYGRISLSGAWRVHAHDIRIDQAGYDVTGLEVTVATECELVNTGSSSAGTRPGILARSFPVLVKGNIVTGWRGNGITTLGIIGAITRNIVTGCKGHGISAAIGDTAYGVELAHNVMHGNTGDGIRVEDATAARGTRLLNNISYGNGGYGVKYNTGTVSVNDRLKEIFDYNAFGANTAGALYGVSAGAHDITLSADPFTNAAGGDYSLNSTAGGGAALKGVAFPTSIP